MRTKIGWLVAALSVLCVILGAAVMVLLGPDSRFTTGPHEVKTDGVAVVTAPKVISWTSVQIDVLAEVPVDKPIFVGLGNSVDVQDYVSKTARVEVTSFSTPWTAKTRQADGQENLPGAPTALDWWIVEAAGLGGARISTTLPDETVSVAILSVGSSNLSGLEVSLAYGIKGGFVRGLGLVLLGLGGLWLGRMLIRGSELTRDKRRRDRAWTTEEVEEVVYVYVDEDGVEHEVSEDELDQFEIEEPPPEPEPEPEPVSEQPTRTTYVFIDESGEEIELGEDELDEFEIVDDDEEETR